MVKVTRKFYESCKARGLVLRTVEIGTEDLTVEAKSGEAEAIDLEVIAKALAGKGNFIPGTKKTPAKLEVLVAVRRELAGEAADTTAKEAAIKIASKKITCAEIVSSTPKLDQESWEALNNDTK